MHREGDQLSRKGLAIVVSIVSAATLIVAGPAFATTFCVPNFHAACPNNGTNVALAGVETAMSSNGSDGIADTVRIAAGTYTDPNSIHAAGTDPLTVRGAGPDQTDLTTSSSSNIIVLDLNAGNARPIDVHDLTVVVPASFPTNQGAAVQNAGDVFANVDIEVRNQGSSALSSWPAGGSFRDGRIYATGFGSIGKAIRVTATASAVTIEDAQIEDADAPIINSGAAGTLTVRDTRVIDPAQPVQATAGNTVIENSTIEMTGPTAISAGTNDSADVSITLDHVTVRNDGSGNSAPIVSQANGGTGDAGVVVRNSILRGFAYGYLRQAPVGLGTGDAVVSIAYTNQAPGLPVIDSGDGAATLGAGNTTADPQLAADMALTAGSPAIDAADPASVLTADILGAPRPVDGDAVPGAIADQGAFEYQPPQPPANSDTTPPDTVAVKGPKRRSAKRKAKFRFSSEPGATFSCRLDKGPQKPCTSPVKVKRLKRGRHLFTVAAADAAGNVDPTPAKFRFRTIRKR